MALGIIAFAILCLGGGYGVYYIVSAVRDREAFASARGSVPLNAALTGGIFFLASMGFPDFVLGTLLYRKTGIVDDEMLPGTLVAATIVPGALIAAIYLSGAAAELPTVLLCTAVEAVGSVAGSRAVRRLGGGKMRRMLGVLMLVAVAALAVKSVIAAEGAANALSPAAMVVALPILFVIGFVNMIGFPMKPSSLLVLLLLGMSPVSAMTVVMTMGSVGPILGGFGAIRGGKYNRKTALCAATFGLLGAAVGAYFALTLNATLFLVILIAMMSFTAFTLLKKSVA